MLTTITPKTPVDTWKKDSRKTLSPTAMSSYEICGKRGQYYQDPSLPKKPSMGTAIGSAYHKALEWSDRVLMGATLQPSGVARETVMLAKAIEEFTNRMAEPGFTVRPGEPTIPEALDQLETMVKALTSTGPASVWDEPGIKVVASEVEIYSDFGSDYHIFHGYIDRVLEVEGYGIVGTDNKSAGRKYGGRKAAGDPRELYQAPLYAEAWSNEMGAEMDWFAYDVMTKKGDFTRIWVNTSAEARAPFVERWRELSASIAMHEREGILMPANPSHFLCSEKWCDYYDICPMGAAIDPMVATQP